jgi:hypothetical protein
VDGGDHAVLAAGEPAEHRRRIRVVARLAESLAVEKDQCVGGEHPRIRVARGRAGGLVPREPACGRFRGLAGPRLFRNVGRRDREGKAERAQDLGAAGGGGGED